MFIRFVALAAFLTCALPASSQPPLRLRGYATDLTWPVAFVQDPTDRNVQFVVQQGGRIRVVRNGVVLASDFLNLANVISSGGERGLLGMAVAPDYRTSHRFYVFFTNPNGDIVVSRFRRSAVNPLSADPMSRFDLKWGPELTPFIPHPTFGNHNAGHLAFGPDGFLYIGQGDGGAGNDPAHNAQNPGSRLGKMLRIDVNVPDTDPAGYRVPPTNPFVGTSALPEIWSFGLRNPWRYGFDDPMRGGTRALVIGDVGQNRWEEIDYEPAGRGGRNYGWRNREGTHTNVTDLLPAYTPLIDPIYEYDHEVGQSVTGGYVYRGHALGSTYRGRYFFADFVAGRVWSVGLAVDSGSGEAQVFDVAEHTQQLGGSAQLGQISSFGVGWDGELYIVSYSRGAIYKIERQNRLGGRDGDFDGDDQSDLTVYRPSIGTWYTLRSSSHFTAGEGYVWGAADDVPVAGDYDGDGRTDIAVFRSSGGLWFILKSSTGFATHDIRQWGAPGDIPVPGDYDGDGKTDPAVYRPSSGTWYVLPSNGGFIGVQWGSAGDIAVPADYDGDDKTDLAVYRPGSGHWFIRTSTTDFALDVIYQWGTAGDRPVPGDYDGDQKTDLAIYRPSIGAWFFLKSSTGNSVGAGIVWGASTDVPIPGDFDGDAITDIAIYRESSGHWFVLTSHTNYTTWATYQWGTPGDVPIFRKP